MYYAMMIIINGNYSRCSDISNTIQTYHPTTYLYLNLNFTIISWVYHTVHLHRQVE